MNKNLSEEEKKKKKLILARMKQENKKLPNDFFEKILNYEMILSNGFDFEVLTSLIGLYSVKYFINKFLF